jgi:hypothetical protein
MSKVSYQQRLETLKIWIEDKKIKSKVKKKQPRWIKDLSEDND